MALWRGSCVGPRTASYTGQAGREKEGIKERKKPAISKNDKISLVEGTVKDQIRCFLSKVMAL